MMRMGTSAGRCGSGCAAVCVLAVCAALFAGMFGFCREALAEDTTKYTQVIYDNVFAVKYNNNADVDYTMNFSITGELCDTDPVTGAAIDKSGVTGTDHNYNSYYFSSDNMESNVISYYSKTDKTTPVYFTKPGTYVYRYYLGNQSGKNYLNGYFTNALWESSDSSILPVLHQNSNKDYKYQRVVVTADETGKLSAEIGPYTDAEGNEVPEYFYAEWIPFKKPVVNIDINQYIIGRDWTDSDSFDFAVTKMPGNSNSTVANLTLGQTSPITVESESLEAYEGGTGYGERVSATVSYMGEYNVTVTEKGSAASDLINGGTPESYTFTIKTTFSAKDQKLTTTVNGEEVDSVEATFVSKWTKKTVDIPVLAELVGRPWNEGETFPFDIVPVDDATGDASEITVSRVDIAEDGGPSFKVVVDDFTTDQVFKISEDASAAEPGMEYPDPKYVRVSWNEDGTYTLACGDSADGPWTEETPVFVNRYTAPMAEEEQGDSQDTIDPGDMPGTEDVLVDEPADEGDAAVTDELSDGQTKTEEPTATPEKDGVEDPADDTKADEAKADDAKADEAKADDAKADDAKDAVKKVVARQSTDAASKKASKTVKATVATTPKTGDPSSILLVASLATGGAALAGVAFVLNKNRKHK